MSTSFIKLHISRFDLEVQQWMSKKCTKKHDDMCRAVVLLIKPILFFEVVVVVIVLQLLKFRNDQSLGD